MSSLERAVLEVMGELPDHESFHNLDMVFESLTRRKPCENRCEMTILGPKAIVVESLNRQNPRENTCELTIWGS